MPGHCVDTQHSGRVARPQVAIGVDNDAWHGTVKIDVEFKVFIRFESFDGVYDSEIRVEWLESFSHFDNHRGAVGGHGTRHGGAR